ncbi:MAG: Rpn family recombination-promoting nuclease/putative transposase [Oscillospiraceae bacterium]|nr:Rpn family recombination-promoting nuclease/putative transposase [Oscillospiraceae bacterium]
MGNTDDALVAPGKIFPRNDLVFKRIFGDKRNGNILRSFLKSILYLDDYDLSKLEIIESSTRLNKAFDKTGILDVKCTTKTGKIIGIELQVAHDSSIKERLVYQTARSFVDQSFKGDNYFDLHKTITIAIAIDHTIIKKGSEYSYRFRYYDHECNVEFTDITEIYILEAKKLPKDEDNSLIQWLKFLKSKSEEEMQMLANKNSVIKEAVCVYKQLTADQKFRNQAWTRQLAIWDRNSQINNARAQGEKIGLSKGESIGINKRNIEIARNLLNSGLDLEFIAKSTGLTKSQIEALKK